MSQASSAETQISSVPFHIIAHSSPLNSSVKNLITRGNVKEFFTDELSGDECAIVWNGTEEICVTADEAWDIEAKAQAKQDAYELRCEIGY